MNETQGEWLESTLSLSKNGGISGKKTETNREAAVLLVGLGGEGADALLQIKNRINKEIQNPNIEYLEIDTDIHTAEAVCGTECFAKTEQEFCDISVDSLQNMLSQAKEAKRVGEECWQWLDEGVQAYADHERIGSCGIRQLGRMQLFMNIDKTIHMISSKIDRVLQKGADRLVISVCSGISGGTGGGILLDVAYILHKIAHMKFENIIMTGYVLMPDVDEVRCNGSESRRTAWRANGYACLKELDYYTRTGEAYCQKFPNGFELNMAARPFDYMHLINSRENGYIRSYEKILMSVAESIMMRMIGNYDTCGPDILLGHPYQSNKEYYCSLGTSEIKMPCTEISTLYISRIFENLDIRIFKNRPTQNQFNISVFKDLEMTEECIRSALYKKVTVQRPVLEVKNYTYANVWPNNDPYKAVHSWLAMFQRSVVPQAASLPTYLEGNFKKFIKRNLKDRKTGPFYLSSYMKSQNSYCLHHMLEGLRKHYSELQVQCIVESKELRENMNQAFAAGSNISFFQSKLKTLEIYLRALDNWYRTEELAFLYEKIVDVLETIQFRVNLYYENILRPLTDTLWQVSKICAQNVWQMQGNAERNWIIQPLEFENLQEKKFRELVGKATNDFGEYLCENLCEWIGRDLDNVDDNCGTDIDIAGSLRRFICNSNLCELHYEDIESCIYMKETSPEKYTENLLQSLLEESSLMYSSRNYSYDREVVILYVPASAEKLYDVTKKFLEKKNYWQVRLIKSSMTDRISVIRAGTMTSLSSNAFLAEMRQFYEEIKATSVSVGIDLHPECRDILFEDDIANNIDEE